MEDLKARPEITSLIEGISQKNGITNPVITDVKRNQKGEGFCGQIFMVIVKDKDEKNNKQLEMVIKAAFADDNIRAMVPIRIMFENEIYFYRTVYSTYEKLENERKVSEKIHFIPKCFDVCVEEKQEMLALENLHNTGFEIFNKTLELDQNHVKLICKAYGRFHAYSYAVGDQEPENYAKIMNGVVNIYEGLINEFVAKNVIEIGKSVQSILIPGADDEIIKKYKTYEGPNIAKIFQALAVEEVDCPAILHGDCWSNNIMFKYEDTDEGRKPTDIRLIDFQNIKVGSPVFDLSYCLYSGASKEIFDNLDEYLQIYHQSFSSRLKELGSDPEKLFPFAKLKEHWKKYAKWGMIMAFQMLKMKLTVKEDTIDVTDGFKLENLAEVMKNVRFNEEDYNNRIKGLLWHLHEIDAL